MDVVQKVVVGQKVAAIFSSHLSWVEESGWSLLTCGGCLKVVVNAGLNVISVLILLICN